MGRPLSKEKLQIILYILLTLISVVIAYLLSQINNLFYLDAEKIISYKALLIGLTLSILFLLFAIVYHFLFPRAIESKQPTNEDQTTNIIQPQREMGNREISETLLYLSIKEKEFLKKFLDANSRILTLPNDDIGQALCSIGILQVISSGVSKYLYENTYGVVPAYWNYMNSRPREVLGF